MCNITNKNQPNPSSCIKVVSMQDVCPHKLKQLGLPEVQRQISSSSKYWNPDEEITYHFIGGREDQRQSVRTVLDDLRRLVPGLKLKEVTTGAQIRVSFVAGIGSWSYIGTDALLIRQDLATMNYGWDGDYRRLVFHEFAGHCLTAQAHEHVHPDMELNWDLLLTDFAEESGWSEATIRNNFSIPEGATIDDFDPDSIMLYYLDCKYVNNKVGCEKWNTEPSRADIAYWNSRFPNKIEPVEPEEPTVVPDGCLAFLAKLFPTFKDLNRLRESQVVAVAEHLGIEASKDDLKRETVNKVISFLEGQN